MDKKITVSEFIKNYDAVVDDKKEEYLSSIVTTQYVGYGTKIALADKIVRSTSFDENKNIRFNTPFRYVLLVYTLINNYTCIHMNNETMLEEFDALNSKGLVEKILNAIPEREIHEFNGIIDSTARDFIANHYETHAYIERQIDKFAQTFKFVGDAITPELEKAIAKFNPETVAKFLNTINK